MTIMCSTYLPQTLRTDTDFTFFENSNNGTPEVMFKSSSLTHSVGFFGLPPSVLTICLRRPSRPPLAADGVSLDGVRPSRSGTSSWSFVDRLRIQHRSRQPAGVTSSNVPCSLETFCLDIESQSINFAAALLWIFPQIRPEVHRRIWFKSRQKEKIFIL